MGAIVVAEGEVRADVINELNAICDSKDILWVIFKTTLIASKEPLDSVQIARRFDLAALK